MQNYKPGTDVPLTFDLVDEAGLFLAPTALSWRILDEAETELQAWTDIAPLPSASPVTVLVPANLTALTAPALRAIRTVEMQVVTVKGTLLLTQAVLLQGATVLAFGLNSFQTYAQALLLAEDNAPEQMPGWLGATRELREKAMIEAFRRILTLPIGLRFNDQQNMLQVDATFACNFGPTMLRHMKPEQMVNLYKPMLENLRLAQLLEADDILNFDSTQAARHAGLLSKTVGESSETYRAAKPLEMPICSRAIKVLGRWVRFGAVIGRS